MTGTEINRMRRCFRVAAVWEGWSIADREEISNEIRLAIDASDPEILACWAAWLEDMSCLQRMGELCRAAEMRIKADAGQRRAA